MDERGDLILLKKYDILAVSPRSSKVELLICNQRVGGSNPSVGSNEIKEGFPPKYGKRENQAMGVRLFFNCLSYVSFSF
jgi:hypothetical protein